MAAKKYTDLFIDFDDTLYDTHGNAVLSLKELYDATNLQQQLVDEEMFYTRYWQANVSLWAQYAKSEITRDYLIVERFRRPLFESCDDASPLKNLLAEPLTDEGRQYCLGISDKFLDFCSCKPGVIDGAHEVVDYLRQRGYRLHICSNGFHEVQYKKLTACGLIDSFDTIVLSEDAGVNKPNRGFFDYALKVTGANPATTLMIGDNYNTDILGAMGAGIDTMLFNRWDASFQPPQPVDYVVATLREIETVL